MFFSQSHWSMSVTQKSRVSHGNNLVLVHSVFWWAAAYLSLMMSTLRNVTPPWLLFQAVNYRESSFTGRATAKIWNALPDIVVSASSVDSFQCPFCFRHVFVLTTFTYMSLFHWLIDWLCERCWWPVLCRYSNWSRILLALRQKPVAKASASMVRILFVLFWASQQLRFFLSDFCTVHILISCCPSWWI